MRREIKISNIIKMLMSVTGIILSTALAPQIATAGVYSDVSIVDVQTLNDAPYSHRLRLQLDNREETLMLNQSDAFGNTNIVTIDGTGIQQGSLNDISVYQGQIENVAGSWAVSYTHLTLPTILLV